MKKESLTIVEFTDTHIKALQVRKQRAQRLITQCDMVALDGPGNEPLLRGLTKLTSRKPLDVFSVLLPGRYVILKQVSLPTHSEEEIRRMVQLQIGNLGPFPREEIVFDHIILEKTSQGYARVLVVVVPKENINFYLKALQKKGLAPQKLLLGSQGIAAWYRYQQRAARLPAAATVMIIDADSNNSEICFCHQGRLFFSRNIRFGTGDLQQDKLDLFLEQVGLTLGAYRKGSMGPEVERIVVAANAFNRSLLVERLEEYYRLPIDVLGSSEHVGRDKNISLLAENEQQGVSLTRGLGFLLGTETAPLNLMPREVVDIRALKAKRRAVAQFILMLFVCGFLAAGIFALNMYQASQRLETVQSQLRQTQSLVEESRREIEVLQALERVHKSRIILIDVIEGLYLLTPPDISFHSLNFDAQGSFAIQGNAISGADINLLQSRLVDSPLFQEVNLQYATKRVRFREEYTEFKIICQLDNRQQKDGG